MRLDRFLCRLFIAAALSSALPGAVQAQSWLETLFGPGSPETPNAPDRQPKPVPSIGSFARTAPRSVLEPAAGEDATDPGSGVDQDSAWRTVCVRTCDGYYFPISARAAVGHFDRDQRVCARQCGPDARLFYLPRDSRDMNEAMDTEDRPYSALTNAFAYRKALINGCTCKPMPWSATEAARHAEYAVIEAREKERLRAAQQQREAVSQNRSGAEAEVAAAKAAADAAVAAFNGVTGGAPAVATGPSVLAVASGQR